jgi:hypothetical protein
MDARAAVCEGIYDSREGDAMAKGKSGRARQLEQMAKRRKMASAGLGQLPQLPGARWTLVVVTPTDVIDPGRVYDLVLVADERGYLRAAEPVFRPASPVGLARGLERAMRRPEKPMKPGQPASLVVADEATARALAPSAQSYKIALLVDDELRMPRDFLEVAERSGYTVSNGPPFGAPHSRERALAIACDALASLEPWLECDETCTFELDRPDSPLAFPIATVMGHGGEPYGVALYRSVEEFERLAEDDPASGAAVEGRAVIFSDRDDLADDVLELWEHRGYPDNAGIVMECHSMGAAGRVSQIDERAADDLLAALHALTALWTKLEAEDADELPERDTVEVDTKPVTITVRRSEEGSAFGVRTATFGSESAVTLRPLPPETLGLPHGLAGQTNTALVVQGEAASLAKEAERLRGHTKYFVIPLDDSGLLMTGDADALELVCDLSADVTAELTRLMERETPVVLVLLPTGADAAGAPLDLREAVLVRRLSPESSALRGLAEQLGSGDALGGLFPIDLDGPKGSSKKRKK